MKNITQKVLLLLIVFTLTMSSVLAFGGDDVETLPVHWVGYDSATLAGNVTILDSPSGTGFFQYKENGADDWINSTQTASITTTGEYLLNIFGLESNTTYVYRAVIETDFVIEDFNEENFTTNASPSIGYDSTDNVTTDGFTFNINVSDLGDEDNISVYVECYQDDTFYTTNESAEFVNETGIISFTVDTLDPGLDYLCYGVADWDFDGATEQTYTEGVEITTTSTTESRVESGILGVKSLTFAAFALLALILLMTMAMVLISLLNNDADIGQLMTVGMFAIGGTIILFVGYIIIASIAGTLM